MSSDSSQFNDDIPGFVYCEACYEDVVVGTDFEVQFVPHLKQQPTNQVCSCDLAIPYLKHSLQGYAQSVDWHGFVQAARHRMSPPTCVSSVLTLRMREKYADACKQRSIDSLLSFASQREQIYQQTIPHIERFLSIRRQKQHSLKIAGQPRANTIQATSLNNGFTARDRIVHRFRPNIVVHTLNCKHQRRSLEFDPQMPRMKQLPEMWKQVE